MICSQYFHNIFTTNFNWQIVTSCCCQKSNLSIKFKFELITINHL